MLTKELPTAARVRPCFIEPMQVAPVRRLPDGDKWSYEAKLDYYRCLAARRSNGVVLWSRRADCVSAEAAMKDKRKSTISCTSYPSSDRDQA